MDMVVPQKTFFVGGGSTSIRVMKHPPQERNKNVLGLEFMDLLICFQSPDLGTSPRVHSASLCPQAFFRLFLKNV